MCVTCVFTVVSPMKSSPPISAFDMPRAIRPNTSRSRVAQLFQLLAAEPDVAVPANFSITPARDRRREEGVARRDGPDGGDQLLGRVVLEDEAAGSGPQCLVHVLVEVEGREDQNAGAAILGEDAPRRLEPVELGHPDVHQDHVGSKRGRLLDRFEPVRRLGDDLDVVLAGEEHPEAGPDHRLVVGDEHPGGHEALRGDGSRVLRTNSPSGSARARHLAPVDLHALANPDEAVSQAVADRRAGAVVPHLDLHLVWPIADDHVGVARVRVLEHIRQPFLNDAVGRQVHALVGAGTAVLRGGARRAVRRGRHRRATS